jgi:muramidase (phage lysozyme)
MASKLTAGQKHLLDFIGGIEAPQGHDTVYGNNQRKLAKPLTQWTIAEIINANPPFSKRFGSSACGRYQFMNATLRDLVKKTPALAPLPFTPQLQDELGGVLLRNRGYLRFISGELTPVQFGKALAQEWASFPVLAATQGAHRAVARGETYYAGDQLNKVLTTPAMVLKTLAECLDLDTPDDGDVQAASDTVGLGMGIMSVPIASLPDPGVHPVQASIEDPTLVAPETPFKGLLSLFQGKPPVAKGDRREVTAQAKEEAPSLMKDLGQLKVLGLVGGAGSLLGGVQDSGLLDSVQSTADQASATFQSVQSLTNIVLSAVKWGVQHWYIFGVVLSGYVLVKVGWAVFKLYVYVRNNIRPSGG